MMLCVKDLWSIFDRICVKKCGRQAIFAYTCVMRGLAVVTFVNWKAHHGPGISNPFERAGK